MNSRKTIENYEMRVRPQVYLASDLVNCCFAGYGMFTYIEESHSVWLNSSSLESEKEFELVGILLGLAIYNGIILDVHFPLVIYKKLQEEKLDLQDLLGVQPSLAKSLMQLLEFDGDVEDTFCYTFQVILIMAIKS